MKNYMINAEKVREFMNSCLFDNEAKKKYNELNVGERLSRAYYFNHNHDYGYFYEEANNAWIAFDNRMNTYEVKMFDSQYEAEQFLIDYNELFAA